MTTDLSLFRPRPSQTEILRYVERGGLMGVSAVPGSGKTHILSYLAARLLPRLDPEQEVLIVTLVNAAVDNFRRRIDSFIGAEGLLVGVGYRVATLHSLAHDIVRERPALVGLDSDFEVVDERAAAALLSDVVQEHLGGRPELLDDYLLPALTERRLKRLQQQEVPALLGDLAQRFIKRAKDRRLGPNDLMAMIETREVPPLLRMAGEIYRDYQARLARTGVDFDDLIRLAAQALERDPDFVQRLRQRWPFILEDEAQDSSLLQEQILARIVGAKGNWVRVGDPNQAIYETFTTASPDHLRNFLARTDVQSLPMPESGRSSREIIDLANQLITWTQAQHPTNEARNALAPPLIEPTPPGDPQPNPLTEANGIVFPIQTFDPEQELNAVAQSVKRWLEDNPERTVAVLVPRNKKGFDVATALRQVEVPYVELLNSTAATRSTAGVLANALQHLARPTDSRQLGTLFRVWQRQQWDELGSELETLERALQALARVEDYLWPQPGHDWLDEDELLANPVARQLLAEFRQLVQTWHRAAVLPIDQLLLRLAQDLFDQPSELALAYKFALLLKQTGRDFPDWRLPEFIAELAEIARNERRFLGFAEEETGFEPPPGKVTVATMHRAKGLEWDRVYLLAVNDYNFPSGLAGEDYFSEKWFVRDDLNLEAEVLGQLETLLAGQPYVEGEASAAARLELVRERLRLLYVGITRARQALVVTWNSGRKFPNRPPNQAAEPWRALRRWLESRTS